MDEPHRVPVHRAARFTLNGTDHATHRARGGMIRRYIAWRNRNTSDPRLRRIVERADVP